MLYSNVEKHEKKQSTVKKSKVDEQRDHELVTFQGLRLVIGMLLHCIDHSNNVLRGLLCFTGALHSLNDSKFRNK